MTDETELFEQLDHEEKPLSFSAVKVLANARDISDKRAWERKARIIKGLVQSANELTDKMLQVEIERQEIWDKIAGLREDMVADCIHLPSMCIEKNGVIVCKFCDKKIKIVDHESK